METLVCIDDRHMGLIDETPSAMQNVEVQTTPEAQEGISERLQRGTFGPCRARLEQIPNPTIDGGFAATVTRWQQNVK